MSEPKCIRVVPRELLDALAAEAPRPTAPGEHKIGTNNAGEYSSRLLVDKWLTDRRVDFRVKAESDGEGRTLYVLKECAFDAGHGDPDSCIMQAANGKLSAQCFHDSCEGRGWQAFKAKIGPPNAEHYDPPLVRSRGGPKPRMGTNQVPSDPPASRGGGGPSNSANGGLPTIQGNKRQLRDVTADALAAVLARN